MNSRIINRHWFGFGIIIFVLFLMSYDAWASLKISVTPQGGGNMLRFGKLISEVHPDKEVRIRVTSSAQDKYQVFQRLVDPLTNERGQTLDIRGFQSYTLIGSNSFGSLYQQSPQTMGYSEQLLYSSSPNGDGDGFTVIY